MYISHSNLKRKKSEGLMGQYWPSLWPKRRFFHDFPGFKWRECSIWLKTPDQFSDFLGHAFSPRAFQMTTQETRNTLKFTQMCKYWHSKRCRMGNECNFAHSREELRLAPSLRGTKLCFQLQGRYYDVQLWLIVCDMFLTLLTFWIP